METKTRYSFFAIVTIFVLLFSLTNPVVVLADDETPPPAPTEEPAQPPEDQPTDEPVSIQEDASVAEVLAQLPEETQVVVVNEEGETVPLASTEAAQIVEEGDPQWCKNGYTPADDPTGANGNCTAPFTRFLYVNAGNPGLLQTLINDAGTLYSGPGTIFISQNNIAAFDQNKNIVLDGSLLSVLSNSSLTIQGGWDFTTQTQSLNQSVFKNSTLQVLNWGNNVTINDIKFSLTGVSGDGLNLSSIDGDVTVNNVTVTGALGNGSSPNGDGLHIDDAHNVTINDSTFNDNYNNGIQIINVDGDITLNNVTASRNDNGSGAYLDNTDGTGDISLGGSNYFNANADNGIQAISNGNISTLSINDYVEANRNVEGSGAYLYNVGGSGYVTLGGTNVFNANGSTGIEVESSGNINLNNVEANRNSANGASLLNSDGSGDIKLAGTNVFYQNESNGLYAYSNGDISVDNIAANQNGSDGAYLDNCNWDSGLSACLGSGDITISGKDNSFNDNDDDGLEAYSAGDISLTGVDANRNSSHGAYLDNTYGNGDITLTDITANFNENGNGVFAYAAGDVSIEGGYFKGNERRGVYAQSYYGNIEVTLSDFINNGASGLRAEAYNMDGIHGNITLDNVFSEKNGIHGANLGAAGNIFITGSSEFTNNDSSGVHIMGLLGNLSVSGSLFSENDAHGLDAEFIFGEVDIENSVFTWNHKSGLNLSDVGESVEINGSDFLSNRHDGAYIYNCGCTISDIIINSSAFSNNGWNGLEAYSHGLISLNNVTAGENDEAGAYLDNHNGTANVNVVDSQFNSNDDQGLYISSNGNIFIDPTEFNNNGGNGLEAYTSGNITLLDVTGNGNQGSGAFLQANRVTITCSSFENNFDYGANVIQTGSLRLNGVTFSGNGSGAYNFSGTLFSDPSCVPTPGGGSGSTSSTIIPITGGEPITCDAALTSTTVRLPKGDEVTLPCPINEFAAVNPTSENELSIPLGGDDQFISALTVHVIRDGQAIESLDKPMQVSFVIPEGKDPENLVILFWNGTEWLDLGGAVSANELYFEISTAQLGTFVLAER